MILTRQIANPSVAALYEDALVYETGTAITSSGALTAYSGNKTGRSPSDKRVVKEESSEKDVWWGPVNKPMTPDVRCPLLRSPCGLHCAIKAHCQSLALAHFSLSWPRVSPRPSFLELQMHRKTPEMPHPTYEVFSCVVCRATQECWSGATFPLLHPWIPGLRCLGSRCHV